mmetsp:Transcript_3672/g.10048  ORF Transcript_3672/g.10048 Transcript_3672/m.10048 type:complete len:295 (-) Transcript_3672:642-1526(-)
MTCGEDGVVLGWDTRTGQAEEKYVLEDGGEAFSCTMGGPSGHLVVAGSKEAVRVWDRRACRAVATMQESFGDAVTSVRFCPQTPRHLLTAGEDGLLCVFDVTAGDWDEDDNLLAVLSADTSIRKFGFYGSEMEGVWCSTNIETLHLFHWREAAEAEGEAAGVERAAAFEDPRGQAARAAQKAGDGLPVDYLMCCVWDPKAQRLELGAGSGRGAFGLFPVDAKKGRIKRPTSVCRGGHTTVVRGMEPLPGDASAVVTGGEDGKVVLWSLSRAGEGDSEPAGPAPKGKTGKRYAPY